MGLHTEPCGDAASRRLADSNRCLALHRSYAQTIHGACEWCGAEEEDLQEASLGLVCARCAEPPAAREPRDRLTPRPTWLYFIQAGEDGPIKIGVAVSPFDRLDSFQTGNHLELRLLGKVRATQHDELAAHLIFAADRIRGEWYAPTPDLLDYIRRATA